MCTRVLCIYIRKAQWVSSLYASVADRDLASEVIEADVCVIDA